MNAKSAAYILGVASALPPKQANMMLKILERLGPKALALYRRASGRYPKRLLQHPRSAVPDWMLGAAGGGLLVDTTENYLGNRGANG